MVIKSTSDIFCEIISLLWTLRICGVIQFTLHGKKCDRDIRLSKLQISYGILIFIVRNICFIYTWYFIFKNFDSYPYVAKLTSPFTAGMNIISAIIMALNLVTYTEMPFIFKKLIQFDKKVKKTKSHNSRTYGELFIHIGLSIFLIVLFMKAACDFKLGAISGIMYVFNNFIDKNVAFLLDMYMINIVVMIKKRFGIINYFLEEMVNNFEFINSNHVKQKIRKFRIAKFECIRDLMAWHNLLCDTVNLTNSFFSVRILLCVLLKFLFLCAHGHFFITAKIIDHSKIDFKFTFFVSSFIICFCLFPLVKLVSSCSSTAYKVR
ncbi:hypothetical protein L9F63_010405, partial [Diploptera punctata]